MKRRATAAALALIVLIGAAAAALIAADRILDRPLKVPEDGLTLLVSPGDSFKTISNELGRRELMAHPDILRWYARLTGKAGSVHAGEYLVEPGTTARQLLDMFVAGQVRLYSFTIVEGWNFRELMSALAASDAIEHTLTEEDAARLLEELDSGFSHPEGLFLPETYRFPRATRDIDLLGQAHELMLRALAEEWESRAPDLPFDDPYHALILASIVERETARMDERAKIAGVFVRRLQKNMRLQTDPTVIYGIGADFDGNLTRRHLQSDTPYNTYTRRGLPPTPIAMPGRPSLHAALHPEEGSELYFVATGLGDGSHKFSETIEEHEAAVREMLTRQRANRQPGKGK